MTKKSEQLLRRSMVYFGVAMGILVLFFILIIPNIGRVSVLLFGSNLGLPSDVDTVPPQKPQLAAAPEATNSAQLSIAGYTEPGSEVSLVWNGTAAKQMAADAEGQFGFSVLLKEGPNTFSAYSIDESQNESIPSDDMVVVFDTQAPELELTSPEDGAEISGSNNRQLSVTGRASDDARVFVNDRLAKIQDDGSFQGFVYLNEGENPLTISAIDKAGNETSQALVVSFKE